MYALSQDSSVTSSEESRIKRESSDTLFGNNAAMADIGSLKNVGYNIGSPCTSVSLDPFMCNDSKLVKSFPWITEFSMKCQKEIGLTRLSSLENLMKEYINIVSAAALDCHLKPKRSAKLKKTMNGTLHLFYLFYSDIKQPLEHSSYLDKMSDLMAIYIDMEITASSRSKESVLKIASKLTSSLFLFLDRSQDHILDAIFKTKYINKNYCELCNLIFSRVLRESPGRTVCDLTYVRYVLAFKMWKRVVKAIEEKKNIMKLASTKLYPPPLFRESVKAGVFSGILPKIPKSRNDITMFLMQAKFCIKEKIKEFLKQMNGSEKNSSFSSYMTNFGRITFSSSNDTDDSRISSEEDQEEHRGGSTALINNIWSSMSSNSGVAHEIRMANIIKGKKLKNKCKKTKCKGIATPVFKSNIQTCEAAEKLKKKRRLSQLSELAAIKPLSTSILTEKCSNQNNITMVRPRMEPTPEVISPDASVGSCQNPSIVNVKKEPLDSPIDLDTLKNVEQVNSVDRVSQNERNEKVPASEENNLKTDVACSPQVWKDRERIPCEPLSRAVDRLVPQQVLQPEDNSIPFKRAVQELKAAKNLILSDFSQIPRDPKQEFIIKTVERIQESGRSFHKSQIKPTTKVCGDQLQETNSKPEPEPVQEKSKRILHDQTLRKDFMTFTRQHVFRSNLLNNSCLPETSVPSPYGDSDETAKRCNCVQCTANHTALATNYKTLTQYLESKQLAAGGSSLDKILDPEPPSCLPFKKRKTVSVGQEEDDQEGKAVTSGTRDIEVSYPNTPMISIAMIDPKVQSLAPNATSLFPSALDYSLSNSSLNCSVQSGPFVVPLGEKLVSPNAVRSVEPPSSFASLSQTCPTTDYKPKFKTPAQLKQCPVVINGEPPAAQITNCPANSTRRAGSRWVPSPKKPRAKGKTETRTLRKRK